MAPTPMRRRRPRPPPRLPNEIWEFILAYVKAPIPPPLSNPERSALQNPSLCAAARVCKTFHFICSKFLYTDIVTCDFPLLLADMHIPSKQLLLQYTRSLRIEYSIHWSDVSYITIFLGATDPPALSHHGHVPSTTGDPRLDARALANWRIRQRWALREKRQALAEPIREAWKEVGLQVEELAAERFWKCAQELRSLRECLQALKTYGLGQLLPNLESIAIASIYGHNQHLKWVRYKHDYGALQHGGNTCSGQVLFEEVLAGVGRRFRHLCVREVMGPLCFEPRAPALNPYPICFDTHPLPPVAKYHYSTIIHFGCHDFELPLLYGRPTIWVDDGKLDAPWAYSIHALEYLAERHGFTPTHRGIIDLSIYCSTEQFGPAPPSLGYGGWQSPPLGEPVGPLDGSESPTLSSVAQQAMAIELGQRFQRFLNRTRRAEDRVRWFPSSSSPVCQACGSGPP